MTISTVSAATNTSTSNSDISALSGNYQMFLQLLVTQMQNQSPLDPMDSSQFTQQLVQYSAVEQQIKANQSLTDLKSMFAIQSALSFVGYVGKSVTVDSSTADLTNGTATWNFSGSAAASAATIEIHDSEGNTVYTTVQKLAAGEGAFEWSGETDTGGVAPAGSYTISITGTDASGKAVKYTSETTGTVEAVDFSGTTPMLSIGGQLVSAYLVKSVKSAS
ncbi:MAG: flagellar hook assembly protein FlgD [Siculibacillus sp.]|nr:flagellar hook assembly protein FlgD [Siculibacillus sp.]